MSVYRKANAGTCVFDESFRAGFYSNGDMYVSYNMYDKDGRLDYFFERYAIGAFISKIMMKAKDRKELESWIERLGREIMTAEDVTKSNIDAIVAGWKSGIEYTIGEREMSKLFGRMAG